MIIYNEHTSLNNFGKRHLPDNILRGWREAYKKKGEDYQRTIYYSVPYVLL